MPPLTRWFIKSSLIFLVGALLIGALQAANSIWDFSELISALGPVYFHLFLVGWVTQLIFGVVFWMFPKYSRERPRRDERLGWIVFWLINFGLVIRTIAEPGNSLNPSQFWGILLALSAVLQWLAGMFFVMNTWGRVKEK